MTHLSEIRALDSLVAMIVSWIIGLHRMDLGRNRTFNHRLTVFVIKTGFVFRSMRPGIFSVASRILLVKTENVAVFVFHGIMKTSRVETATRGRRPKKTGHHLRSAVIRPDSALTSIKTWPVVK